MENKKTPEQWFMMLKEPYRSEAIANLIHKNDWYEEYPIGLKFALNYSFDWGKTKQGYEYWEKIHNSIEAGETTYLEPETLKPEQMESGKWYVVDTFLIKFKIISNDKIYRYKCCELQTRCDYSNNPDGFIEIQNNDIIRPATKEEVLKYFPDEVSEPIELRPEDLVSGEVYKATDEKYGHWWIFQHLESNTKDVIHSCCINYDKDYEFKGTFEFKDFKFYHATPEEVKLLLGEEQTDWEKKYNELKSRYEVLVTEAHKLDVLSGEMCDKYTKLKAKYDQLETKGEKVYFYFHEALSQWKVDANKQFAIDNSPNHYTIYEGYSIGEKKSVLVSEAT